MEKTANYQLNQWEPTDKISRGDFNADNVKLDAALAASAKALSDYRSANDAVVAKKAEQSALDSTNTALTALQQSMNTEFAAVAANLGSGGKNARIAWGSYTGNGTFGENNSCTLSFDFCPVLVITGCNYNYTEAYNPSIFLRGRTLTHPDHEESSGSFSKASIRLTWSDNAVSWYSTASASAQNNTSNYDYYYVAIGYDAAAEATV